MCHLTIILMAAQHTAHAQRQRSRISLSSPGFESCHWNWHSRFSGDCNFELRRLTFPRQENAAQVVDGSQANKKSSRPTNVEIFLQRADVLRRRQDVAVVVRTRSEPSSCPQRQGQEGASLLDHPQGHLHQRADRRSCHQLQLLFLCKLYNSVGVFWNSRVNYWPQFKLLLGPKCRLNQSLPILMATGSSVSKSGPLS